ncbi:hypothetical protein Agabi119p4_8820 [Agaricus bisporus var. burnettii]|uniref:DHHA2 domain-containing protein n=1 Tax=Agaricus bisporus var. burnettii TaxID=192524 RepID=A0A8H7C467_AGABI|nr:hypothetical protein Agabi119p4_8820 [Agaricus bisporus var. burnettii]
MSDAFRRLSVAFKLGKNKAVKPMDSSTTLADFLVAAKQEYLKAIQETPSRGEEWTVVMGNEACDLDTMASSIAYAWVESEVHKRPTVPLIPRNSDDLDLRAENVFALKQAGLSKPQDQLLFISDIPQLQSPSTPFPSHRLALVDHNKIKERYLLNNPDARVVAVVDHREDEGLYKDSANPRIVLPCGSCCSHIATKILPKPDNPSGVQVPRELATLLLCGIVIDTDGLRPGGKALQLDRDAAATLLPLSTYGQTITPSLLTSLKTGAMPNGNAVYDEKSIKDLAATLSTKKKDISHFGTRDLLRRDYKQYDYRVEWLTGSPTIRVGLTTIPLPLKTWAKEGKVEKEILSWMKSRGLHVYGGITSFKDKSSKKKENDGKGKSRREQVWMFVDPAVFKEENQAYTNDGKTIDVDKLAERILSRLETDESLKLEKHKHVELNKNGGLPVGAKMKVYHQTDPKATRKYTAPLIQKILTEPVDASDATPNDESSRRNGQATTDPTETKL